MTRAGALLAAALIVPFLFLALTQSLLNDGDTSWHLATGQMILRDRAIPHVDPFSFTFAGHPWTAHEWLADVIMALVFQGGGWAGILALFAGTIAIALVLVTRELLAWLPARYALLGLAALVVILAPYMLARPHVLVWPVLVLWVLAMLEARESHTAPALGWAVLMLAWANTHASYLIGLGLAGLFALEALVREPDRRGQLFGWAAFGLVSLLAAVITPHGPQGLLFPLQVSGMESLPLIQEWRSSTPVDDPLFFAILAVVAGFAWISRGDLGLFRLVLIAGLGAMAVLHARHQPLFVITAFLLLPRSLPERLRGGGEDRLPLASLMLLLGVLMVARAVWPTRHVDSPTYPATAIASLPADLRTQPVFNSYSFGGPLILTGIRPYIDGRADMYGDDFTAEHHSIVMGNEAAFRAAEARYGIRWTMLQPGSPLIVLLDRSPGWRRAYADDWAIVHVRR